MHIGSTNRKIQLETNNTLKNIQRNKYLGNYKSETSNRTVQIGKYKTKQFISEMHIGKYKSEK